MAGLADTKAYRQRMAGEYFTTITKHHRRWMRELVRAYKARGRYPVMTLLLGDYYRSKRDKEIALFATLLMSDRDNVYEQVQSMRELITDHPYQWVKERRYVDLSIGTRQNEHIKGNPKCEYWKIARLMDLLHSILFGSRRQKSLEVAFSGGLLSFGDLCNSELEIDMNRARLLTLALRAPDGVGRGVWTDCPERTKSPLTSEIIKFLGTWFPDYRLYGSEDDAIQLFGLERESDFFYAWLAWKELSEKKPQQCEKYVLLYANRYKKFCDMRKQKWDWVLPEIEF